MTNAVPKHLEEDFWSLTEFAEDVLGITNERCAVKRSRGEIEIPVYQFGRRKFVKKADGWKYVESLRREPA
jgi:hypothetical protein